MYTLGIETSCDETSAAVIKNGSQVLSNVISSSLKLHTKYGGIIPEIASRAQLEFINPAVCLALEKAKIKLSQIKLIAVTYGPGLGGCLMVGLMFAKGLSFAKNIPFIGVDHIKAHLYAPKLTQKIKLPFIGLVISGGHTSLFFVKDFNKITLLGRTVDDAAGEAFDKTAKILGLPYPGGPHIEKIAKKRKSNELKFSCGKLDSALNFSFSGIKTAVLYKFKSPYAATEKIKNVSKTAKADIAGAFQEAVFEDIVKKSLLACKLKKVKSLVVGGGVACNNNFREKLYAACKNYGILSYFPEKGYCMDNAAMIAGLGYQLYKKGKYSKFTLNIKPT